MPEIPYTVRTSRRAKRILLKIDPLKGLVVVLPQRLDPGCIPNILAAKRSWIAKHYKQIQQTQARLKDQNRVPDRLDLPALGAQYTVQSIQNVTPRLRLRQPRPDVLEFSCRDGVHPVEVAHLLRNWLKHKAREILPDWLDGLARRHGLTYSRVSVRCQKSRWGSCSSKKTISLNCKLLFLPPRLVEHVLLHELCHTVHPNHGPAFWGLLQSFQPDALSCRQKLKRQWLTSIPAWMELE